MGLKVTTDGKAVTVYVKEKQTQNGGTFKTYSIAVASKYKDGNWINGYLDCQFKKADADKISNKCKINITNSFYTVNEYNGNKYLKLFVLDFDVAEQGEVKPVVALDADGFMNIPDGLEDDMPFN